MWDLCSEGRSAASRLCREGDVEKISKEQTNRNAVDTRDRCCGWWKCVAIAHRSFKNMASVAWRSVGEADQGDFEAPLRRALSV